MLRYKLGILLLRGLEPHGVISMSTFESFIRDYGYWALLVGTFLEGETILIIGGLSARLGILELPYVMLIAFIGSFFGDQFYYYIGYLKKEENSFPGILSGRGVPKKYTSRSNAITI